MATAAELQERLALYRTAETRILEGNQSYTVGSTTFTRADLRTVRDEIRRLEARLEMAEIAAGSREPLHSTAVFGGRR